MAVEIDPTKSTSVELTNPEWVFVTNVLRQMPYGSLVDSDMTGLMLKINSQIIGKNQPTTNDEPQAEPAAPA